MTTVWQRAYSRLTPDAAAQLDVPRGTDRNAGALRSRGEATLPEVAHPRLGYRPDLDGLRALAVLGVLINHASLPAGFPSGTVGVTAFFVLSGYLITGILLGGQGLREFYIRRFRRLAPALAVLLAFVTIVGVLGGWTPDWPRNVVLAAAYIGNWFSATGTDLGPVAQTWSLAIEEQFYLVWPALLVLTGRRGLMVAAVIGIGVAFALRATVGGEFAYYGTFTRIDAILAGALLAIIPLRLPRHAGWLGLALLGAGCLPMDNTIRLPLATVAAMFVIVSPVPVLGRLAFFGKRAYGIYLWDFTLTRLVGPGVGGALSIGAAELSYRLVEARVRLGKDLPVLDVGEEIEVAGGASLA